MQWPFLRLTLCSVALLAAAPGCEAQARSSGSKSSSSAHASPKAKPRTTKNENAKPSAPTPAAALSPAELEALLCKGHAHCRAKTTLDAGVDASEQPMQVVEITTDSKLTDKLKKNSYYFHENDHLLACEPLEYWFVRPTLVHNDSPEARPALLTRACGGSDPRSVTEPDKATVEPGLFRFSTASSSGVIYSTQTSVELPSLQIIESTDGYWARNRTDFYSNTWSWQKMAGQNTGFDPHCENETGEYDEENFDTPNFDYQPIIITALPAGFRDGGWKSTALASCSTAVTSLGNKPPALDTGYVTHGKPGAAQDASFQVIMGSPTELYVEVRDPTLVRDAKNILHTDHLEVWMRDGFICSKPYKNLFQWGITLDGEVHNFYGKHPESPTAETHIIQNKNGEQTVRFKISIPGKHDGLTVVYSDSDDGKSQKRLIATSAVKYRDPFSIGATKHVAPERGRCRVEDKRLVFSPEPQKPESPVISSDKSP